MSFGNEFTINSDIPSGYEVCSRIFPAPVEPLYKNDIEDTVPQVVKDWFARTGVKATFAGSVHTEVGVGVIYVFENKHDGMMFKLVWG